MDKWIFDREWRDRQRFRSLRNTLERMIDARENPSLHQPKQSDIMYSIASGQNSAPCRVIVGLRLAQSYIPGVFFSCRHSRAAALSGFFCV